MDLRTYLENAPLSKWHVKFLLITAAAWAFDAMDTGIISFVIAELARQWGLSGAQIGALGSSGLVGMALGAMFAGGLADKFGRKVSCARSHGTLRRFCRFVASWDSGLADSYR